ncbi:MAG: HAD family hydrolase [Nitrososphaerales archaeon]|nr:HAD family hydrolase [Nitrososphaerales archaeon]
MALGVLFDIDGTLVSFEFDVQGSRKALFEELTRLGFDTSGLSPTSPTQHVVDYAQGQVSSGAVNAKFGDVRRKLYAILDDFELKTSPRITVLPGVYDALESLKRKHVKLAVLTNSGRRAATDVLKRGSLLAYFDFVLTRDDVDSMKPSPGGVKQALSVLALREDQVFYVGDSVYDIMAAKTAGLKVISVATGNYTAERLRGEGADVVIGSLAELQGVLPL